MPFRPSDSSHALHGNTEPWWRQRGVPIHAGNATGWQRAAVSYAKDALLPLKVVSRQQPWSRKRIDLAFLRVGLGDCRKLRRSRIFLQGRQPVLGNDFRFFLLFLQIQTSQPFGNLGKRGVYITRPLKE